MWTNLTLLHCTLTLMTANLISRVFYHNKINKINLQNNKQTKTPWTEQTRWFVTRINFSPTDSKALITSKTLENMSFEKELKSKKGEVCLTKKWKSERNLKGLTQRRDPKLTLCLDKLEFTHSFIHSTNVNNMPGTVLSIYDISSEQISLLLWNFTFHWEETNNKHNKEVW